MIFGGKIILNIIKSKNKEIIIFVTEKYKSRHLYKRTLNKIKRKITNFKNISSV